MGIPKLHFVRNRRSRTVDQHTIAVVTDNDNFVLDVTRDVSHRVPNRCNLLINYQHSVLRN